MLRLESKYVNEQCICVLVGNVQLLEVKQTVMTISCTAARNLM